MTARDAAAERLHTLYVEPLHPLQRPHPSADECEADASRDPARDRSRAGTVRPAGRHDLDLAGPAAGRQGVGNEPRSSSLRLERSSPKYPVPAIRRLRAAARASRRRRPRTAGGARRRMSRNQTKTPARHCPVQSRARHEPVITPTGNRLRLAWNRITDGKQQRRRPGRRRENERPQQRNHPHPDCHPGQVPVRLAGADRRQRDRSGRRHGARRRPRGPAATRVRELRCGGRLAPPALPKPMR